MHVFNLGGELHRTIEGAFGDPFCIAFRYGYLWVIESEYDPIENPESQNPLLDGIPGIEWSKRRLLVLDPTKGDVRQVIRLPEGARATSMSFHGNRVYVYGGPHHEFIYVIELTQLECGSSEGRAGITAHAARVHSRAGPCTRASSKAAAGRATR